MLDDDLLMVFKIEKFFQMSREKGRIRELNRVMSGCCVGGIRVIVMRVNRV